jgi:uncharacterized protein YvpB
MKIVATANTIVKQRLAMRSQLLPEEFTELRLGDEIEVESDVACDRKHYRFLPADSEGKGIEDYRYAYMEHVKIVDEQGVAVQQFSNPYLFALEVQLGMGYLNQRDNLFNPNGSCNVTCMAMVLNYLGVKQKYPSQYEQFEDELYDEMDLQGWVRHDPYDLATLMKSYSVKPNFTEFGSIEGARSAIRNQSPVVIHGYFTTFGHIIVLKGFDEDGFRVYDPYGEWHEWGYDRNDSDNPHKGRDLHYSYDLIRSACMPDGNLWMHTFPR